MLQRLLVQNYALIDQLELQFEKGLNIITGETGAGKSILLGAMSLILGQRSDSSALLDKTRKCIVEGEFGVTINRDALVSFFKSGELDFEHVITLRREISAEGKSRSFINDTPVNLQQLKELGALLVDIHSQHETLMLNQSGFQLSVVDAFASHELLLQEFKINFQSFKSLEKLLDQLKGDEKKSKADQDYFQFQFNELKEANLQSGELEKLEYEINVLTHAEEIRTGILQIILLIDGEEGNLASQLNLVSVQTAVLGKFNHRLLAISQRLKNLQIELKDVSAEIESVNNEVEADPQRLQIVNDRLDQINLLLQKHRLKNVEELVSIRDDFESKLLGIDTLEEKINSLEKELLAKKERLVLVASAISANRMKAIPEIESKIKKLLIDVGMPNAVLRIENEILPAGTLGPCGSDQIRFLFSANKGIAYSDISKVASGGELSRLMLCLKASVARLMDLPSIIFDEIDTGVSGETAFRIGHVMQEMSKKHQLIAITHLPQIASRGEAHFFVYKEVTGKKTVTRVRGLSTDERVVEIARMLSGDKPSAVAIENAKELLKL